MPAIPGEKQGLGGAKRGKTGELQGFWWRVLSVAPGLWYKAARSGSGKICAARSHLNLTLNRHTYTGTCGLGALASTSHEGVARVDPWGVWRPNPH